MIEVVVLFFIVIVIVLCILSIMYKCTDGSMDPNGFSVDTCFKLGDPKKDDDKTSTKTDESATTSPLLSGGGLLGSLFGSSLSGEEDEVDYSPYVDYFTISKDGVKVEEHELDTWGEVDKLDSLEVDANGPGECAKICYEKDEIIGHHDCNAFKMNSNGRKCKLYWSTSKSGVTEDENVFRLKARRGPYTHEAQAEQDVNEIGGTEVMFFNDKNYKNPGLVLSSNVYFESGAEIGRYEIGTVYPKSIYIPPERCVLAYNSASPGADVGTEYTDSVADFTKYSSLEIGTVNAAGLCDYPENNDSVETFRPQYKGTRGNVSVPYITGGSIVPDENGDNANYASVGIVRYHKILGNEWASKGVVMQRDSGQLSDDTMETNYSLIPGTDKQGRYQKCSSITLNDKFSEFCVDKTTQESCEGMKSFSDNSEVCKWKSI